MPTNVSLVAPVASYRGGIARHSGMVAAALHDMAEVRLFAEGFARLYPQLLYPGKDPRLTDPAAQTAFALREVLDTLDPRSWRKVADDIAARGGVAVFPAWTFFTAPCLGWIARSVRRRGVEVVTIVHNVADHEGSWWKARLVRWQIAASERIVTHSEDQARAVREAGFTGPITVEPHPPFTDFPMASGSLPPEYALELLCFGLVRPYKGIDIALEALALADLPDARLTVAGEIWPDAEAVRSSAAALPQVHLIEGYIPDQQAADLFVRADALLLPYRSVTGSGVLAMARHYRVPVIASDLPALAREIAADGLGWTFPAGDAQALADLLRTRITRAETAAVSAAMPDAAESAGWHRIAIGIVGQPEKGA